MVPQVKHIRQETGAVSGPTGINPGPARHGIVNVPHMRVEIIEARFWVEAADGPAAPGVRLLIIGVFGRVVARVHFVIKGHALFHGRVLARGGGWFGVVTNVAAAPAATVAPVKVKSCFS